MQSFVKNTQYYKFCAYGFLKNLRFFDAFFILFLVEKGLSFTEIGILYAGREIVINVFEIPSGIISDTFGRKNSLLASFILYIISFLVFYFSSDFWLFLLAFSFFGMADAFRSGTHKSMIMDYLKNNNWKKHKINYYGHTRSCSQKGSAISALIAGFIVFFFGNYQMIFLLSIIPYLFNFVLVCTYPSELNKTNKSLHSTSFMITFKLFLITIKQPKVFGIMHSSAVYSAFQKAVKDYIQPIMLSVAMMIPLFSQVSVEKKNGLLIGFFYFIIFLLTSQASLWAASFDVKTKGDSAYTTLLYGFLIGMLSGLFFYYDITIAALFTFVGIYIIENIRKPILTGSLADEVPNELLTSVISAQSQWKTILTAGMALLLGVLADYFGIGIALVVISAILLFITLSLKILT
jgi:MFS family permease